MIHRSMISQPTIYDIAVHHYDIIYDFILLWYHNYDIIVLYHNIIGMISYHFNIILVGLGNRLWYHRGLWNWLCYHRYDIIVLDMISYTNDIVISYHNMISYVFRNDITKSRYHRHMISCWVTDDYIWYHNCGMWYHNIRRYHNMLHMKGNETASRAAWDHGVSTAQHWCCACTIRQTDTLALLPLVKRQVFCVGDRLKMDKHQAWATTIVAPK